jgi:hypothetical protein
MARVEGGPHSVDKYESDMCDGDKTATSCSLQIGLHLVRQGKRMTDVEDSGDEDLDSKVSTLIA